MKSKNMWLLLFIYFWQFNLVSEKLNNISSEKSDISYNEGPIDLSVNVSISSDQYNHQKYQQSFNLKHGEATNSRRYRRTSSGKARAAWRKRHNNRSKYLYSQNLFLFTCPTNCENCRQFCENCHQCSQWNKICYVNIWYDITTFNEENKSIKLNRCRQFFLSQSSIWSLDAFIS